MVTGDAVFEFVKGVLEGGAIPKGAADPKFEKPKSIQGFRPISLCNVCLKLAKKMIANRFKTVLNDIIGSFQTSFIPGRQGINNFAVYQEVIHTLKYTKAKRGGMVLKLDMEKAYDRMEWRFVKETLLDAGLPRRMVSVIMNILSESSCRLSSCRLFWNGEATKTIRPTRGFRQGDEAPESLDS